MHYQEQIGDYVLELAPSGSFWGVRMAGDEEYLSKHPSKSEAKFKAHVRERVAQFERYSGQFNHGNVDRILGMTLTCGLDWFRDNGWKPGLIALAPSKGRRG